MGKNKILDTAKIIGLFDGVRIFIFDKTVDNYVIRSQQYINTFNKTNNNY